MSLQDQMHRRRGRTRRTHRRRSVITFAASAAFAAGVGGLATVAASAGDGGPPQFDVSWHTVDGGGGAMAGGDFEAFVTIAQPEAGAMSGGDWSVAGGFISGGGGGANP